MKTHSTFKKVCLVLFGILLCLLFLELFLKSMGFLIYCTHEKIHRSIQRAEITILCIGDSFTFGVGAPENSSYPAYLERILKEDYGEAIKVINSGVAGFNTSRIYEKLCVDLKVMHPEIVILLAGDNNYYSLYGYYKSRGQNSVFISFRRNIYKLRVFKLIKWIILSLDKKINNSGMLAKIQNFLYKNHRKIILEKDNPENSEFSSETVSWLEKAIKEQPENEKYYALLGFIYLDNGEAELAESLFTKGIEVNQESHLNYAGLGRIYFDRGQYQKAINFIKKALEINPDNVDILLQLGIVISSMGRYDEALKLFTDILETNPQEHRALVYMAEYYHMPLGYFNEGVAALKAAIKLDPQNDEYYKILGDFYIWQSDFETALQFLEQSLILNPFCLEAYDAILQCYEDTKSYDRGINFLKGFLRINPECKTYIQILKTKKFYLNINRWIADDLEVIINYCKAKKIKIVLLNYPHDTIVNSVIERAAKKLKVPLVDNYSAFENYLETTTRREEFFNKDLHPKDKGYEIIALHVYEVLENKKMLNRNSSKSEKQQ